MSEYNQNMESLAGAGSVSDGWPWKLFIFTLIVFLTVAGSYAGLVFGYRPYLSSRIETVNADIQSLTATLSTEEQADFLGFYSQIANLKSLLDNHMLASKFFPFFEQRTNKKVFYETALVNASQRELTLEGAADNYAVLSEQLEAFNQSSDVVDYTLNQSQLSDGKTRFRATLRLSDKLFK